MKIAVACLGAVALASPVQAGNTILYFTDQESFNAQMLAQSKVMKGIETFEYANVQQHGKTPFPDNLTGNTPHSPVFPNGLMSPNLTIRTNRNPGPFAAVDAPSNNPQALYAVAAGAFGANSIKVGEDLGILSGIQCSMDLIFGSDDKTGVGFELSRFTSFGNAGWTLGVFDINDVLIGQFVIPGPVVTNPSKVFFGVWSASPIGRINVYDPDPTSPDAVDDIQMWTAVPSPSSAMLLAAAGVVASRRRR